MGEWDEFSSGSEMDGSFESFENDSFDATETVETVDINETLDNVENMDTAEYFDEQEVSYIDDVMTSVEPEELEFEDDPKVLTRDLTPEIIESRIRDTEETLDNYRDNLRDYGVDEGRIESWIEEERIKINQEYESLDQGITDENIYEMPTDWEAVANSLKDVESTVESAELNEVNEVSDWLNEINPNFDPFDYDSPYCNNCGSCAYAVYQRLEGNGEACATADNIPYNSEMEALTGMEQISMSPDEIRDRLLEAGDGAHAIIGIDRAEGPGHWFNAACIDGKVVAIDGQTGEINDWPPDYGDVVNWEMSIKKEDR